MDNDDGVSSIFYRSGAIFSKEQTEGSVRDCGGTLGPLIRKTMVSNLKEEKTPSIFILVYHMEDTDRRNE